VRAPARRKIAGGLGKNLLPGGEMLNRQRQGKVSFGNVGRRAEVLFGTIGGSSEVPKTGFGKNCF